MRDTNLKSVNLRYLDGSKMYWVTKKAEVASINTYELIKGEKKIKKWTKQLADHSEWFKEHIFKDDPWTQTVLISPRRLWTMTANDRAFLTIINGYKQTD